MTVKELIKVLEAYQMVGYKHREVGVMIQDKCNWEIQVSSSSDGILITPKGDLR